MLDNLAHGTATNTLCANLHGLVAAVCRRDLDTLKVGFEFASCNACDLRADASQVLRFATRFHRIAHLWTLPTNLTCASHRNPLVHIRKIRFQIKLPSITAAQRAATATGGSESAVPPIVLPDSRCCLAVANRVPGTLERISLWGDHPRSCPLGDVQNLCQYVPIGSNSLTMSHGR